jgi:hypothetical protein
MLSKDKIGKLYIKHLLKKIASDKKIVKSGIRWKRTDFKIKIGGIL